jgi:hypothetical protein
MKYIEFFGFGGSGKSTLVNRLVKLDAYDGPDQVYDIKGWDTAGVSISGPVPRKVRKFVGGVIWRNHLKYKMFTDFVDYHNDFVIEAMSYIAAQHSDKQEARQKQEYMREVMMRYQAGRKMTLPGEYFCLDNGFYHKTAVSEKQRQTLPDDSYFDSMPQPDIIVHVDPEPDLLQRRRRQRESHGEDFSIAQLEEIRSRRAGLMEAARDRGTTVIRVANEGTPESAVETIHSEIQST